MPEVGTRMKYFCKNCGTFFELGYKAVKINYDRYDCKFCEAGGTVEYVPEYETPEQYEKRMGEPYPDSGPVWIIDKITGESTITTLEIYKETLNELASNRNIVNEHFIVCANYAFPPPNNWKPEGVI
jgi:hypothetical protein